jgi:hypothetical protein
VITSGYPRFLRLMAQLREITQVRATLWMQGDPGK